MNVSSIVTNNVRQAIIKSRAKPGPIRSIVYSKMVEASSKLSTGRKVKSNQEVQLQVLVVFEVYPN